MEDDYLIFLTTICRNKISTMMLKKKGADYQCIKRIRQNVLPQQVLKSGSLPIKCKLLREDAEAQLFNNGYQYLNILVIIIFINMRILQ